MKKLFPWWGSWRWMLTVTFRATMMEMVEGMPDGSTRGKAITREFEEDLVFFSRARLEAYLQRNPNLHDVVYAAGTEHRVSARDRKSREYDIFKSPSPRPVATRPIVAG